MKALSGNPFRSDLCRRAAAFAAASALLLLALIPAGFMPSVSVDGKVAIVICSGMGSKTVMVDAADAPDGHSQEKGGDACPFFLAQSPVSLTPVVVVAAAPIIVLSPAPALIAQELLADIHVLPPPARGPPAVTLA